MKSVILCLMAVAPASGLQVTPKSSVNVADRRGAMLGLAGAVFAPFAANAIPAGPPREEAVPRKDFADSSGKLKYSYQNMPWEDLESSTAKYTPKTNWNTLYPEKRLVLEKKSPVSRQDLAPAGGFETYAKTYPGLYSAISGLPMGQVADAKNLGTLNGMAPPKGRGAGKFIQ